MKNFNSVMQRFALPLCNAVPQNTIENHETLDNYFKVLEAEFDVDKSELNPPEPTENLEEAVLLSPEKEEANAVK